MTGPVNGGWKLGWIEGVAKDGDLTALTVRVAIAISSRADSYGVARTASQIWIAERYAVSDRAVRNCITRLLDHRHLLLLRRGHLAPNGSRRAAEYRLIRQDDLKLRSNIPESTFQQPESTFRYTGSAVPPFPEDSFPEEDSPLRARELPPIGGGDDRERDGEVVASLERCWLAIKKRVAERSHYGENFVAAWFKETRVEGISAGILTLVEPTRFLARQNTANHAEMLLAEWRAIDPSIKQVVFKHVPGGLPRELPRSEKGIAAPAVATAAVISLLPLRERLKAKGKVV